MPDCSLNPLLHGYATRGHIPDFLSGPMTLDDKVSAENNLGDHVLKRTLFLDTSKMLWSSDNLLQKIGLSEKLVLGFHCVKLWIFSFYL